MFHFNYKSLSVWKNNEYWNSISRMLLIVLKNIWMQFMFVFFTDLSERAKTWCRIALNKLNNWIVRSFSHEQNHRFIHIFHFNRPFHNISFALLLYSLVSFNLWPYKNTCETEQIESRQFQHGEKGYAHSLHTFIWFLVVWNSLTQNRVWKSLYCKMRISCIAILYGGI